MSAPTEKREELLKELEQFAFRGIPSLQSPRIPRQDDEEEEEEEGPEEEEEETKGKERGGGGRLEREEEHQQHVRASNNISVPHAQHGRKERMRGLGEA